MLLFRLVWYCYVAIMRGRICRYMYIYLCVTGSLHYHATMIFGWRPWEHGMTVTRSRRFRHLSRKVSSNDISGVIIPRKRTED